MGVKLVAESPKEFESYFHQRASRFAAFYKSETVSRVFGRGALFDRLQFAVDTAVGLAAKRVLDVGCGSGPLFAPLAGMGIHVKGIDPAEGMVALASQQAAVYPGLVDVEQRSWQQLTEVDDYDLAVALGVFDYVDQSVDLLTRMGRAATHVVGSFPSHGSRTTLRKFRYGRRGVSVHGYGVSDLDRMASDANLMVIERSALGRAGFVVHFGRP
jgi:2-polyprenyl-3-methyl-5-hydroxy-6-metoxy-1,4-benzoquinol methylase